MDFVADLHLHSKYSRAVSQEMVLPQMANWAKLKGIDILSATDFTHPLWFRGLKSQLEETSEGLYSLRQETRDKRQETRPLFLLTTEIASIYKQGEKLRRIHNLVFVPSLEVVEKINSELTRKAFNLLSDGRPILGLSSENLLELLLSIDQRIFLIPCHVWTPHFGLYGSASGFDSIEEAFGNLSKYIYGIETGLSSDPQMNWQVEELKNRSILSFSDAHSGPKMGREATVFVESAEVAHKNFRVRSTGTSSASSRNSDGAKAHSENFVGSPRNIQITYNDILSAVKREKDSKLKIAYTIEFYPEEGKYHFSGHRNCRVVRGPVEIRKDGDICPVCKKRLTEGVLYRVQQLSDEKLTDVMEEKISPRGIKWYTDKTKNHPPYVKLVPLLEIVSEALSSTASSQKTRTTYENLCQTFGSEIEVLLKTPLSDIEKEAGTKIREGIEKVRKGDIVIAPGYDGEYGKVKIWPASPDERTSRGGNEKQASNKNQLGLGF